MGEETIVFEARDLQINALRDDGTEKPIVKRVNFKVPRGKVVALIGESGSGKTTISLSALGYCKPGLVFAGGQAILHGEDLTKQSNDALREKRGLDVAYLAQSAAATFNPARMINDQVIETPVVRGLKTRDAAVARAEALYRALELPDPENIGKRYPHQVSGGQLQRLMAAMALCGDPDLLVLDEPTTALDVTTQVEVLKTIKKVIADEDTAAIYVTHDLAVVAQVADYIVVLYNGEVQERGTTDQIINSPQHPYTRKLIEAVRPVPAAGQGEKRTGSQYSGPPVLTVENVTAGYGTSRNGEPATIVLRDVTLSIKRGSALGIIGESGSGKSTLARVMAGLLAPATGEVRLNGSQLDSSFRTRSKSDLRKVQFVYQMADTALNPRQPVADILGRPLEFYLGLKGRAKKDRIIALLELVELSPDYAQRMPHELSGGQKQRVNLARALAAEPDILLCDEVTSALDSIVAANVIELLKRLRRELGVSFVFISHDLSTVSSFSDEIAVLYAGSVAEKGPTDQVLSPPHHPYTRLLISSTPEMRLGWLDDTMAQRAVRAGVSEPIVTQSEGCAFFGRCPLAIVGTCDKIPPPRRSKKGRPGLEMACHREPEELG